MTRLRAILGHLVRWAGLLGVLTAILLAMYCLTLECLLGAPVPAAKPVKKAASRPAEPVFPYELWGCWYVRWGAEEGYTAICHPDGRWECLHKEGMAWSGRWELKGGTLTICEPRKYILPPLKRNERWLDYEAGCVRFYRRK